MSPATQDASMTPFFFIKVKSPLGGQTRPAGERFEVSVLLSHNPPTLAPQFLPLASHVMAACPRTTPSIFRLNLMCALTSPSPVCGLIQLFGVLRQMQSKDITKDTK